MVKACDIIKLQNTSFRHPVLNVRAPSGSTVAQLLKLSILRDGFEHGHQGGTLACA